MDILAENLRDLVKFVEMSIPLMQKNWRQQYKDGYQARLDGEPRITHHARRRGFWFRGWDDADKKLSKKKKKSESMKSIF